MQLWGFRGELLGLRDFFIESSYQFRKIENLKNLEYFDRREQYDTSIRLIFLVRFGTRRYWYIPSSSSG